MKGKENTAQPPPKAPQAGPDGKPETPKQKVERLRAQARAARMTQSSSGVDRWIEVGRRVANKTHKGMVYSLIVASGMCLVPLVEGPWVGANMFSRFWLLHVSPTSGIFLFACIATNAGFWIGICGVLTVYSMVSLTLYNRRQRTLWHEKEVETLNQARIAQANGTATPDQLDMVKKEEIAEIVKRNRDEEKAQKPWAKAKRFLFEKMNPEDTGATAAQAAPTAAVVGGTDSTQSSVVDAVNAKNAFDAASEKTGHPMPGQLDVMAENAERAAKEKSRGWTSWLTGR